MGAAIPLMSLGLGVGQGVMSYQAGKEAAKAAEANAASAVMMQNYERKIKEQNIAIVRGEEKAAIERQEYTNKAVLGKVTSQMGASGVQLTGSFMEVLAEQIILGHNKNAMIRSQSLRQQTGALNAGNLAVYQNEYAEYAYLRQAEQAKQKATMGLLMGVGKGLVGFKMAGGEFGNLFKGFGSLFGGFGGGGNTLMTMPSVVVPWSGLGEFPTDPNIIW